MFIVLYGERGTATIKRSNDYIQDKDEDIDYRENIRVITLEDYIKFLRFDEFIGDQLIDLSKLADAAADTPSKLEELISEYSKALVELEESASKFIGWSYFDKYLGSSR